MQEEHYNCRALVDLCSGETPVRLSLPAFAVGEAYEAFERKRRERRRLHDELLKEITRLGRSQPYAGRAAELRQITSLLVRSGEEEKRRLDDALKEVLGVARILPLEEQTFRKALSYQDTLGFEPQDSLVFASVVADLEYRAAAGEPSCLITKNTSDFADDDVIEELGRLGCRALFKYEDGLGYARSGP